ncbi:MAG: ATP-grasp domain-containing protein [Pseudomonadota bacterium]
MARANVLLTLGRLPKALELARALHEAGCRVVIADPSRWHLSKPSKAVAASFQVTGPAINADRFRADILSIVEKEAIDLVVPISEEALAVAGLADRLPPTTRLLCARLPTLERLHDKLHFIETATAAGLDAPQTYRADRDAAADLALSTETVVKPRTGCSGGGLAFLDKGAVPAPKQRRDDFLIQQRIRGREISSLSFCENGVVRGNVLYEGRTFAGTVATAFRRITDAPAAERWIERFVAACGYSGFIAFDFIIDEAGRPWPLECNPRLTSGIHFMDPTTLAAAVLGDAPQRPIAHKPERDFQEGHTTLALAYGRIFRPREFLNRLRIIAGSRDVLWSSHDPLPFLLMTPMSIDILKRVIFKGESFGQAATHDIAWTPPTQTEPTEPSLSRPSALTPTRAPLPKKVRPHAPALEP